MGLLRLLLAVSVVLAHVGTIHGYRPLESAEAVQTFYMISGFYMALILSEKYTGPGAYRLFLTNRFLRIYPTYWAVLMISVAAWLVAGNAVNETNPLTILRAGFGWGAVALIVGSNLLLFGQDVVMFSGVSDSGELRFSPNFALDRRPLWHYLLVPQAWSLSIELMFYAVAPFIIRSRTRTILLLMGACALLRVGLFLEFHFRRDPWTYRFAPSELLLFSAGILAYRMYIRFDRRRIPPRACAAATAGLLLLCATYQWIPIPHLAKQWAFYCLAWCAIPLVFLATKSNRIDRQIGELSYPIYLSHWLFVIFLPPLLSRLHANVNEPIVVLGFTILFSLGLTFLLTSQVERLRKRIARQLHPNPISNAVS